MKISLCMIVKDEEAHIGNCLSSVSDLVDEIIIVDTGSTDKTKEICSTFTDKIYDFAWIDDFSAARNDSFSKATGDFILWLDADDVLKEQDRTEFIRLRYRLDSEKIAYSMIYDYTHDADGNVLFSLKLPRLVKRVPGVEYWKGVVHEYIAIGIEDTIETDIHVTHTRTHSAGSRNLEVFEANLKRGFQFSTRDILYYAKELHGNGRIDDSLAMFNEYLNREDKWEEDVIDAFVRMGEIYKQKGDTILERLCYYRTFEIAIRAEALYPLSLTFSREGKYNQAIYFLDAILALPFPDECKGFIRNDEWNLKPLIELSFCYYQLGNMEKAREYHERAKSLSPNNPVVQYNEQFMKG